MTLRAALVGAGSMGTNHARVVSASGLAKLEWVIDADRERAVRLAREVGARPAHVLDPAYNCDLAIVASSTATHLAVAEQLLEHGVPILVEKPLATCLEDVVKLIRLAEENDVPLACGFVERFNPAIATARQLLEGPPQHLVAIRHSPPNLRPTSSVVDDLLIHDIDLSIMLAGSANVVSAHCAASQVESPMDDGIVDASLVFENGFMALLTASRLSQRKIRTLYLTTAQSLYEIDLLRSDVSVYRHRAHEIAGGGPVVGYRSETALDIPFVRSRGEPLALQFEHFVSLVLGEADAADERASILPPHELAMSLARGGDVERTPMLPGAVVADLRSAS